MPPKLARREAIEMTELFITEYSKADFQRRLHRAWEAAAGDRVEQIKQRQAVCLPIQRPIMERFGFEGSRRGVAQCIFAFNALAGDPEIDVRNELMSWLVDPEKQSREACPGGLQRRAAPPPLEGAPALDREDAWFALETLLLVYSRPNAQASLRTAWESAGSGGAAQGRAFQDHGLSLAFEVMEKLGFCKSLQGFAQLLERLRECNDDPSIAAKVSSLEWLVGYSSEWLEGPAPGTEAALAEAAPPVAAEAASAAGAQVPTKPATPSAPGAPKVPSLTREELVEMEDMLIAAYSRRDFQSNLHQQWEEAGEDEIERGKARQRACLTFQIPILEKYGFEPTPRGATHSAFAAGRLPGGPDLDSRNALLKWLVDPGLQKSALAPSLDQKRLDSKRISAWESSPGVGKHTACATSTCKYVATTDGPCCCVSCPKFGRGVLTSQSAIEDDGACDQDGHSRFCARLSAFTLWSSWWEGVRVSPTFQEDCKCLVVPPPGFAAASWPLPVLLFLTGVGHVNGKESFLQGGVDLLLRNPVVRQHCIVVALLPTTRCGVVRMNSRGKLAWREDAVWIVFTEVLRRLTPERADPSRLYATGFSLGATGVWRILSQRGRHFAAAVTVSGYAEWAGDAWPDGCGPSDGLLDNIGGLPVRAYEIETGTKDDLPASPGWDMTWLNWGQKERLHAFSLRGMDPGTQLDVTARDWSEGGRPGRRMELWTVKGPLHDCVMMSQCWGGDTHCLWYRVFPFAQWCLGDFFLRNTCPKERQWRFTDPPAEIDIDQANIEDWESFSKSTTRG